MRSALDNLWNAGNHTFVYAAFVYGYGNPHVNTWMNNHGLHYTPTGYFDDGYTVRVGSAGAEAQYAWHIANAGSRDVNPVELEVTLTWLGNNTIQVDVTASNMNNNAPGVPSISSGQVAGNPGIYSYSTSTTDPEGHSLYYQWYWEDGDSSAWLGPYSSGVQLNTDHEWTVAGDYAPKVRARDEYGWESDWSDPLDVHIYTYVCGDADGNSIVEISDAVFLISYVFVPGSPTPDPLATGDPDCNTVVEISDAVYLIGFVFVPGSPAPCDTNGDLVPDC